MAKRTWNYEEGKRLYTEGYTMTEIGDKLGVKSNTISKALQQLPKSERDEIEEMHQEALISATHREIKSGSEKKVYDKKYKKPILVFSDPHIPFNHKHFLKFLIDIDRKFKCDEQKICTGDLVDNHAISRHRTSGDADGAKEEYLRAKEEVKKFVEVFKKVKFVRGNHDDIPTRQASEIGLYHGFLKSFPEVWELPDTWEIDTSFEFKDVIYKHGINCGGVNGARATAIKEAKSTVMGHIHSHGGIHYSANKTKIIFGANAGCGIDTKSYAFEYGKEFKDKPTLGCVVVFSPEWAVFIPMDIDYYNEKYGK